MVEWEIGRVVLRRQGMSEELRSDFRGLDVWKKCRDIWVWRQKEKEWSFKQYIKLVIKEWDFNDSTTQQLNNSTTQPMTNDQ